MISRIIKSLFVLTLFLVFVPRALATTNSNQNKKTVFPECNHTPTPTPTPKHTPIPTPTHKPKCTPTPIPTKPPKPTESPTPIIDPTPMVTPTVTPIETPMPTVTPTETPIPSATPTETPVPNVVPTETPSPNPSCDNCGGGDGSPGATVCDSLKPQSPINFSVQRSGTTANLTWTEMDNTTHYSIVYGTQPGKYEYGVVNTGKTNHYTIDSLVAGKQYFFAISSVNNCMPSDLVTSGQVLGAATVKGLAFTGGWTEIVSLFAVAIVSLILFMGVSKLISLCENDENIRNLIETTKRITSSTAVYLYRQLQSGVMVFMGPILEPGPSQLCFCSHLHINWRY